MSGTVIWHGRALPFFSGETLAQALRRAGIAEFGQGDKGQGCAVFCGIGQCQNCLVVVSDKGPREACLTLCHDGLVARPVETGHG